MKHFHYYDERTGVLHGDTLAINANAGHKEAAAANCPPGHKPIEGHFDPLSQRVDVATGQVIDYQPEQPSNDHEWDAQVKRWRLNPEMAAAAEARRTTLAKIRELEAGQARAVREAVLTGDPTRLAAIEAQIAELRRQLVAT